MLIFVEIAIGYPHPNGYPDADRPSLMYALVKVCCSILVLHKRGASQQALLLPNASGKAGVHNTCLMIHFRHQ
jgi:hypothetical protein